MFFCLLVDIMLNDIMLIPQPEVGVRADIWKLIRKEEKEKLKKVKAEAKEEKEKLKKEKAEAKELSKKEKIDAKEEIKALKNEIKLLKQHNKLEEGDYLY